MKTLTEILRNYFPVTLHQMAERWGMKPPKVVGRSLPWAGVDLPVELASRLSDPEQVGAMVAGLPPLGRTALRVLRQTGPIPLPELRFRLVVGGFRATAVNEVLEDLVERGLVLPQSAERYGMMGADFLRSHRPAVLASGVGEVPPGLVSPPEHFPTVDPKDYGPVHLGDPARMGNALVDLLHLIGSRRIKLTRQGWLSATQQSTVAKQIPNNPLPQYLVELALCTGLVQSGQDGLVPGKNAERCKEPLATLLAHSFWESLQNLRESAEEQAPSPTRIETRVLTASVLARTTNEGWFAADALLDRMVALQPAVGFGVLGQPTFESVPRKKRQRAELLHFLNLFGRAFGILDMAGSPGIPSVPPELSDLALAYDYGRPDASWTPPPSGIALRITPLGRAILRREQAPVEETSAVQSVIVTPDFEIVVPSHADRELHFLLGRACTSLPTRPGDPVRRYRLERERWATALQGGLQLSVFRASLEAASGRPLPQNVAVSLESWSSGFGGIRLLLGHSLHSFDKPAEKAKFLREYPQAVPVEGLYALLPHQPRSFPKVPRIDYLKPLAPCVNISEDGTIELREEADLLVASEVAQVADRVGEHWQISRASVQRANWKKERMVKWLEERTFDLDPVIASRILGWSGVFAPAALVQAELLELSGGGDLLSLMTLPEIRALILGVLPPNILILKSGVRSEVEALLVEYRVKLRPTLKSVIPVDTYEELSGAEVDTNFLMDDD